MLVLTFSMSSLPYPTDKKLLATLPSHAEYDGSDNDLGKPYAVYALGKLDTEALIEALNEDELSQDGATYVKQVSTLRAAFDDFLELRKDREWNHTFFVAAEEDYEETGVLGVCLNTDYEDKGRVGVTRCPEISELYAIPVNLAIANMNWNELVDESDL